jgi:flavin reductase (DIM6/NTAB) family NADH-FMN oxidoreductase RutF
MSDTPATVFRCLTTGVYVVTVAHGGRANAFTAAWVMQVSFEPLLLALSINPEHDSYPLLRESREFTVNVLTRDQLELARHFGCRSGRDTDKLAGISTRPGRLGAPVLADALAYLECRVAGRLPAGDHEVVIGQPTAGGMLREGAEPLVYRDTGDLDGSLALYPPTF